MNFKNILFRKLASQEYNSPYNQLTLFPFVLAAGGSLKAGLEQGLGIVMAVAFIYGIIQIIGGIASLRRGDPDGKMGIVAGILIAGSIAIMKVAYTSFGIGGAALDAASVN
jgi:hypothetical protein